MVRLAGFQAINDERLEQSALQVNGETVEAQESRVASSYEHALILIHRGEHEHGRQLLESILAEPLLQHVAQAGSSEVVGVSSSLGHLRFLVLKNLAEVVAPGAAGRALELYSEAALIQPDDVNLWNRLGSLAIREERLDVARAALEAGLALSPGHRLMQDWLLEVLLALGDLEAAGALANRSLASHPQHPRMRQVATTCRQLAALLLDCHAANEAAASARSFPMEQATALYTDLAPRLKRHKAMGTAAAPECSIEDEVQVLEVANPTWDCLLEQLATAVRESGGACISVSLAAPAADETEAAGRGALPTGDGVNAAEDVSGAPAAQNRLGASDVPVDADAPMDEAGPLPEGVVVKTEAAHGVGAEEGLDGAGPKRKAALLVPERQRKSTRLMAANENTMDGEPQEEEAPRASALEVLLTQLTPPEDEDLGTEEAAMQQILDPVLDQAQQAREVEALRGFVGEQLAGMHSAGAAARLLLRHFATATGTPLDPTRAAALRGKQLLPGSVRAFVELLDLAGAATWRISPEELLLLAECHVDQLASIQQAAEQPQRPPKIQERQVAVQDQAEEPLPADVDDLDEVGVWVHGARDEEDEEGFSPRQHHKEQAEDLLAKFCLAMMRAGGVLDGAQTEPSAQAEDGSAVTQRAALLARYHWTSGCLEELQGCPTAAEEHFLACSQLCSGEHDHGSKHADIKIRLAHMQGGTEVSRDSVETHLRSIQLRHDLEDAPAVWQRGTQAASDMASKLARILLGRQEAAVCEEPPPSTARRAKRMLPDTARWLEALECLSSAAAAALTGGEQLVAEEGKGDGEGAAGASSDVPAATALASPAQLVGMQLRSALLRLDELLPNPEAPSEEVVQRGPGGKRLGALLMVDRRLLRALADSEAIGQQLNDLPPGELVSVMTNEQWLAVLRRCQWRAAHLLARAHSAAVQLAPPRGASYSLSTSSTAARRTLFEVVMGFCGLMEMDLNVKEDPAATEQLMQSLFQVLVDAGAVGLDRLRLPNHVIRRLNEATAQRQAQLNDAIMAQREAAGAAEKRKETDARDVNEEEEEEDDEGEGEEDREAEMAERDDLIQSLRGATFQCLFAMFGVDLPQRNTQWGDCDGRLVPGAGTAAGVHQQQRGSSLAGAMAMARDGDDAEGASREMWLEVWKCLGTLLRGHGKTGKRHRNPAKVTKDIIERIVKAFPSPPEEVLAPFSAQAFEYLDGDWEEEPGWEVSPPRLLAYKPDVSGLGPVERDMYQHLYFQHCASCLPFDCDEGAMLSTVGWEAVAGLENSIRNDLALNPRRLAAWERLSQLYDDALGALQADLAQWVGVSGWHAACSTHQPRLAMLQRRVRRAWVAAVHTSGSVEDSGFMEDNLGCSLYREAQSLPPLADQRGRKLERGPAWRGSLEGALRAFKRAEPCMPEEWSFPYYQGKILAKFGAKPDEYLHLMARGCRMATVYSGGLLEPLYRLHASRLKLILQDGGDWAAARAHCFLPETTEAVEAVDALEPRHRELLLSDCLEAMRWVLDKDKFFHKAVYRLAKAHAAQGDIPAALEQLTTIFSKNVRGRRTFAINMRCIDSLDSLGFQGKNQRKRKQQREELGDAPEAHWGHAPRTIKEPGIEEPSAKMMGAMRKYLVLYIELLATSGTNADMDRLEAVWQLVNDATFKTSLEDLGRVALGHYLHLLTQRMPGIVAGLPASSFAEAPGAAEDPPVTSAVAEQSEPAEARHQEATPPPKAPTAGRLAVTSPGVVNSAFAWLRGKVGKSPLGKPAPPDSATAPDEPKVEPEPARAAPEHPEQVLAEPPPPSLEDVMAKGKPHLEAGAAEWLRQLPGSAVTVVERTHRLYTELLVAEGGDASAMEACLAAAISSAGVQAEWPQLPRETEDGSAPAALPALELLSEVHLARLAHVSPPEEARKSLEAHQAALKRRFKSYRVASGTVRRAYGVMAAAFAALMWRQAEGMKALATKGEQEDASAPAQSAGDAGGGELPSAGAARQEESLQQLKRCYASYKNPPGPALGASCRSPLALLSNATPATWAALLVHSFQAHNLALAAAPSDLAPGSGEGGRGDRPHSLPSVLAGCELLFSTGARRPARAAGAAAAVVTSGAGEAPPEALKSAPGKSGASAGEEGDDAVPGTAAQRDSEPDQAAPAGEGMAE